MSLTVQRVDSRDSLDSLREAWERLDGGIPFRSFDWLTTWWKHYGAPAGHERRVLHLLVVRDARRELNQQVMAIAPWYEERSRTRGQVIRWLGSGEVCSDHPSILCQPEDRLAVVEALTKHLIESEDWNRLELEAIDESDETVAALADRLAARGCATHSRPVGNCWSIELPETWDEFLAMQSKSHRKQLRRAAKYKLDTDRCEWHSVEDMDQLVDAWPLFIELHQQRRNSLGEPGSFASPTFAAFHGEMVGKLLEKDQLRLSWVELDGIPVAAEYHFTGGRVVYAYQGGLDSSRLDEAPGRLSLISTIQAAIAEGAREFDFLRGDETYKEHWRATPHATYHLRVLAPSHSSNWLAQTADWADAMASSLKAGLRPLLAPGVATSCRAGN